MVDFRKLRGSRERARPVEPTEIFKRLPKPPHINDLWESQGAALREWHEHRSERDLVFKLNTGGGKTLVGLLVAQSLLNERGMPVIYLSANRQLVRQTLQKAREVGLSAVAYAPGEDLPVPFLNHEAILVATYHALFNGRTKFGLRGVREPVVAGGIVLDDAHTASATLRDIFTLAVRRVEYEELYKHLTTRFRHAFKQVGRDGTFDAVCQGGEEGVLELSYWAWHLQAEEIRELLSRDYDEEFGLVLPLLRDEFQQCHALITKNEFLITPLQPLVEMVPTFADCDRRIYMSATIADDGSIIRTFGADPRTVARPIAPMSLAGVGERMILAPTLVGLDEEAAREAVRSLMKNVTDKYRAGVVILVPSEAAAEQWRDAGRLAMGDAVQTAVEDLVERRTVGPFIFPNRYDGIDLPQDSCRLLVLDGLPRGSNAYDLYRATVLRGNSSINLSLAQRVEQGMGRGTRGAGDHCLVLLLGRDLVSWISQTDNLSFMTSSTRAQIRLGHEVARVIQGTEELVEVIEQCLNRDEEWTKFHAETLGDQVQAAVVDPVLIEGARAEREFLRLSSAGHYREAASLARQTAEDDRHDRRFRGWMLQLAARAMNQRGDDEQARQLQTSAFAANNLLLRLEITAPYETISTARGQVENILSLMHRFALRRGLVEQFEEVASFLTPAATSNQFESAIEQLGRMLGFTSQRPENDFGVGPDNLWLTDEGLAFVIECKMDRAADKTLRKRDHGQLLTSVEWFRGKYPNVRPVGVILHPNPHAHSTAAAENTLVLTLTRLHELVTSVRRMLHDLCSSEAEMEAIRNRCGRVLQENDLTPRGLIRHFLQKFETL